MNKQRNLDYVKKRDTAHLIRLQPMVIFFAISIGAFFFTSSLCAQELLQSGTWSGTLFTHEGSVFDLEFIVSYADENEQSLLQIKMINLDLEPISEFTYILTDISLQENQLKFKIPKAFETKQCKLEKESEEFFGTCVSTFGGAEEFSEITMSPPPQESFQDD